MSKHPPVESWPEWSLIRDERSVLSELIDAYRTRDERHLSTAYPLLDAVADSTLTLEDLCASLKLRDAYIIARAIYETAVNACFIVTGGEEVAERAWAHARQKALRDLDRTIEMAGRPTLRVRWSGVDDIMAKPTNQAAVAEFTSRAGREITSWTPENVRERLEAVYVRHGEKKVTGLLFGLLFYRHASELAHGTLYGALFALGGTDPQGFPRSVAQLQEHRADHCRMLLMLTAFSIASLVSVLAPAVARPELAERATERQLAFSQRPRPDA